MGGNVETLRPASGAVRTPVRARLRQYELIREIGRGGMSTVYLARDTKLARRVAIKFLAGGSPDIAARSLDEARATARCSHENIVVIHEVDEVEGQPYMVLEYLEGRTLRQLIGAGAMSPGRAIELAVPIARALEVAHAAGIVHRDLKPENVFVTDAGHVKVLDFGVAKMRAGATGKADNGALIGTLAYMAPEQWGTGEVDHRADQWALGVVLFELVAGGHPLAPTTRDRLLAAAGRLDDAMPTLQHAPVELERVVARCLSKRKQARFADTGELRAALEQLLPRRRTTRGGNDNPYPGLAPFREEHADRFHGRDAEIARVVVRLDERPLVGVVGASGAGKSSLIRAGVIPELRAHGAWDVITLRPGRQPLAALDAALLEVTQPVGSDADILGRRLAREPGALGELLRERARTRGTRVLVFVDQAEELYTLASSEARRAFIAALLGAADDPASPVRVVLSLRSDFLDRAAADTEWISALTPGLVFIATPAAAELRAALVEPARSLGYAFERPALVDDMVDELSRSAGALPLLQFAAGRLWEERDRTRQLLTENAYRSMGGVAGALASHADAVVAAFAPGDRAVARSILQRLVTPDRTRDIVDVGELADLGERATIERILAHLVDARLLVIRAGAGPSSVELVHESLIERWPTLRQWLEQSEGDAAMLSQLRAAARAWDEAGRSNDLVWRGEAADTARRFARRQRSELAGRERAYLAAVLRLADRAARTRRLAVAATISLLGALVVAAAIALVWIREAEQTSRLEAERARAATEQSEVANDQLRAVNAQLAAERDKQAKLVEDLRTASAAREEAIEKAEKAAAAREIVLEKIATTNDELRKQSEARELAIEAERKQRALADEQRALAKQAQAEADSARAKDEERKAKLGPVSRKLR